VQTPEARELFELARRLRLSSLDLSVLCGVATETIRRCELTGRLPARRAQREAVLRFLQRSRGATKRSELRLEDLEAAS
jgi:hypothetical protein